MELGTACQEQFHASDPRKFGHVTCAFGHARRTMTDYSKWAELSASLDAEDVSDANATPADAPDDLMGGDSDDENAHMDPEYRVEHCEEDDVGTTIEVFPKTHGEGAITKKLIASGVEYDNPKDGWAVELSYVALSLIHI